MEQRGQADLLREAVKLWELIEILFLDGSAIVRRVSLWLQVHFPTLGTFCLLLLLFVCGCLLLTLLLSACLSVPCSGRAGL